MTPSPATKHVTEFFNGEGISDETKSLVSTLLRERGCATKHMYQYDGFWYAPKYLQGVVASQRHFQAKAKDIILASSPKCGTTWLKAIAFALVNRQTLDGLEALLTTSPHSLVPFLELDLYIEPNKLPDLSSLASPRIFGTHIPLRSLPRSINDEPSCKIVYVSRNPKDAFVSGWHFYNKLRPEEERVGIEDMFDRFCDGKSSYGPFWDHVLGYWRESLENPDKMLFIKYEEMKEEPASQLRRLAEFLGCPFSPEEESRDVVDEILRLCSFDQLSNLEVNKTGRWSLFGRPYSVLFRKGEVGDGVNYLTPDMAEKIDRITDLKMHGSGLKF